MSEQIFPPRRDEKLTDDRTSLLTERYSVFFENMTSVVNETSVEVLNSITENNTTQNLTELGRSSKNIKDLEERVVELSGWLSALTALVKKQEKQVKDILSLNVQY